MGRRLRPQTPAFFFFGLIGNIPCRISLKQTQPSRSGDIATNER
jgi:hypothetical protein